MIDCGLGQHKGRTLFGFGLFQEGELFSYRGQQTLIRPQPAVQQHHALDGIRCLRPGQENLLLTGEKGAAPEQQPVVIGTIAGPLPVRQDLLHQNVVKKGFEKIAALLAVLVGGKECGDFCAVVFQRIAGADQFVFLAVLVVVGNVAGREFRPVAGGQAGRPDGLPIYGGCCGR